MTQNPFQNAKYIKAAEKPDAFSFYDPIPRFRKEFTIDGTIEKATIFVQSPGFATYYINGRNITEDIFISAISEYHKILWYNQYDVTAFLKEGKNTLCIIAGTF